MKTEIIRDDKKQNGLGGIKLIPQTNDEFTIIKRFWDENDSGIHYVSTDCILKLLLEDGENIETAANTANATGATKEIKFSAEIKGAFKGLVVLALIIIILSGIKYILQP